jgi:hypothetical protein
LCVDLGRRRRSGGLGLDGGSRGERLDSTLDGCFGLGLDGGLGDDEGLLGTKMEEGEEKSARKKAKEAEQCEHTFSSLTATRRAGLVPTALSSFPLVVRFVATTLTPSPLLEPFARARRREDLGYGAEGRAMAPVSSGGMVEGRRTGVVASEARVSFFERKVNGEVKEAASWWSKEKNGQHCIEGREAAVPAAERGERRKRTASSFFIVFAASLNSFDSIAGRFERLLASMIALTPSVTRSLTIRRRAARRIREARSIGV